MKMPKVLKLKSNDGKIFEVDAKVAACSKTINDMLINLQDMEDDGEEPVPLPNVDGVTLERVIKWAEHHKDDNLPAEENTTNNDAIRTDDLSEWDVAFMNIDIGSLFELILAANYLDIKCLLDTTCKQIANMIKGRTAEEIRTNFKIQNDFTPAEEEQLRKENTWAEEK